jgi:glycosyltransferase involved in cell wall biosynthesis
LLTEEYEKWGMRCEEFDEWLVERELREYDECDLIVVPSTFSYQTFLDRGIPARKLALVPYGVDIKFFTPRQRKDTTFRVLYLGALSLRKGIPYLMEAIASLDLSDHEVWLAGPIRPEARPFLRDMEGRYRYFGVLKRDEIPSYLSKGSVLVLPSIEEGLALVQAQAMACGLPVIASENTGARDLFTDSVEGFIVPPRDARAIREKIRLLYDHPEVLGRMSHAAASRVRALGGWSHYGDLITEAYARLLART